jgi:hypothetical protein
MWRATSESGISVLILILITLSACSSQENWEPKQRPPGVPVSAIWAGGPDGGSYIWCDLDAARDVNTCTVWNDFTGGVVESGEYRLLRQRRAATKEELQFRWADRGGWIGLMDGKILDNLDGRHPR